MEKGRCWRPFHEFGPVSRTRTFATFAGRCVQAEGCPVKTITFPLFETQTEISLDIGSPSFRYVDDGERISPARGACKEHYMTIS